MNVDLKDTFEFHVQKRLTGVDGYTSVWQCLGPSIDAFSLLVLIHTEEGSGFSLQDIVEEAIELGLLLKDRVAEVLGMIRQDGLLAGTDEAPEIGELASRLMTGLNEKYPKMQGIVLPAFLVQILQELVDGRNDLDKALEQVDQTLVPQEENASVPQEDPAEAEARRDRFLKRISTIRKRLIDDRGREVKVQEVASASPKGALRTLVVSTEEDEASAPSEAPGFVEPQDDSSKTVPQRSQEEIQRDAFLTLQREKMELERQKEAFLLEKKRLEEDRHRGGLMAAALSESEKETRENLTRGDSDGDIAAAVARFEEALSLGCPVCNSGKLETRTTDNGKTFYRCDNRSCGFVTWKRPYPFACPLCKNPFLVENETGDGLSCPRSVCTFTQQGLEAPQAKQGLEVSQEKKTAPEGTKRVRKVRRVVRKKK
ncbi:DUF1936 domain-containing protein [Desulfoluna sp.]|uniref:DUF1936 domain-containing protein n=1 Tax=Desulfoluna sp. TaxID=2045199 RepID=UPI002631F0A1|nr:DUF1936 domain-containing protein [Desulfoluna sp.]